ncbi:hypothetical protein [Sulfitobacter sp.]|uniref:hypothetical protein n=1 Tax=Sulfitobacter sp. TaxID=1903071 RepID=UPI0030038229
MTDTDKTAQDTSTKSSEEIKKQAKAYPKKPAQEKAATAKNKSDSDDDDLFNNVPL